jgi:tRNA 2-selenouridine synthase
MPVEKINIDRFLELSDHLPVIDVRSPAEFAHAHIPNAYSLPLFTDEQRAIIGTAYTQQSREIAVNIGLEYFSERMKKIHEEIKIISEDWHKKNSSSSDVSQGNGFLIHCWRGGMRSEAVGWLLNLYGYKVYLLRGGYKSFRRWVLAQFEKKYSLRVIGGYAATGKTEILKALKQNGKCVIDLEGLANHKGSAFGCLGEPPQPGHQMFENLLALELYEITRSYNCIEKQEDPSEKEIWLEDESAHIGRVGIPKVFWQQMRTSPLYFMEIPFEERVKYLVNQYGIYDKEKLIDCTLQIQKRLGNLNAKNAISLLNRNDLEGAFSILLRYYDKMYAESFDNRGDIISLLKKITCEKVTISNLDKLLSVNETVNSLVK